MTGTRDERGHSHAAILAALPHGPSFRFITQITELVPGRSAAGVWCVTGDEPFFKDHFPGDPIVPGVLLGESLAQLSGIAGFAAGSEGPAARLAHIDVKLPAAARPPARIELSSSLERAIGPLRLFAVSAAIDGRRVAQGTITLAAPETAVSTTPGAVEQAGGRS